MNLVGVFTLTWRYHPVCNGLIKAHGGAIELHILLKIFFNSICPFPSAWTEIGSCSYVIYVFLFVYSLCILITWSSYLNICSENQNLCGHFIHNEEYWFVIIPLLCHCGVRGCPLHRHCLNILYPLEREICLLVFFPTVWLAIADLACYIVQYDQQLSWLDLSPTCTRLWFMTT